MLGNSIQINGARIIVRGHALKENCPVLRNTRIVDLIAELSDYGDSVDVHDFYFLGNRGYANMA